MLPGAASEPLLGNGGPAAKSGNTHNPGVSDGTGDALRSGPIRKMGTGLKKTD